MNEQEESGGIFAHDSSAGVSARTKQGTDYRAETPGLPSRVRAASSTPSGVLEDVLAPGRLQAELMSLRSFETRAAQFVSAAERWRA